MKVLSILTSFPTGFVIRSSSTPTMALQQLMRLLLQGENKSTRRWYHKFNRAHSSLAVARSLSRTYSPALIGGYFDGFSALTQLGSVFYQVSLHSPRHIMFSQLTSTI